jgi:hypothetical protein
MRSIAQMLKTRLDVRCPESRSNALSSCDALRQLQVSNPQPIMRAPFKRIVESIFSSDLGSAHG